MYLKACVVILVTLCLQAVPSTSANTEDCKVDVAFCVDNSGSIGQENWPLVLDLVKSLVTKLNVGADGSHAGLVDFGDEGYPEFNLGTYTTDADVNAAVSALTFRAEGTYMARGLQGAFDMLNSAASGVRSGVPKLIVLITDGVPSDSDETKKQVQLIKAANIRILAIGIGSGVDETFLKSVATTPADYAFARDFNSLSTIAELAVSEETCKPPPPSACEPCQPPPPPPPPPPACETCKPSTGCPVDFDYFAATKLCYKVVENNVNYADAEQDCKTHHPLAHLVAFRDPRDQLAVTGALYARNQAAGTVAIGGQRQVSNACSQPFVWRASSKYPETPVSGVLWGRNQPDCTNGNENCLQLTKEENTVLHVLNDIACDTAPWHVCQVDI